LTIMQLSPDNSTRIASVRQMHIVVLEFTADGPELEYSGTDRND
jgi:hypothetical protein